MLASRRVAQLAQRLGFDLTDTLTGDIELLADFLEGVVGVHVDTEAHAQDLGFTGSEAGQHFASGFLEAFDRGYLCGLSNAAEIIGNILEIDFKTNDFSIEGFSIGEKYEK